MPTFYSFCLLPQTAKFRYKLECLANGDLSAALRMSTSAPVNSKDMEQLDLSVDMHEDDPKKLPSPSKIRRNGVITAHCAEATRDTINDLFKRMPPMKCANCKCSNPAIKKHGAMKLFQVWKSAQVLAANLMRGLNVGSVLEPAQQVGFLVRVRVMVRVPAGAGTPGQGRSPRWQHQWTVTNADAQHRH